MKHVKLLAVATLTASFLASCNKNTIPSIYRTPEEWKESYRLLNRDDYKPNQELSAVPEGSPTAKCNNGTFVGKLEDGVNVFRGVPYAKKINQESGLRFQRSTDPEPSNKIYEAYYFAKSWLQKDSENEPASLYEKGEDCLYLNVWNNPKDKSTKKPVLVYIHGGGWNSGGTCDPLYNGYYFTRYNPNVILVTITYRFNILGLVNLGAQKVKADGSLGDYYFSDYQVNEDKYKYAVNNAVWDQVQALKYIHDNIAGFGGDPNNVTVSGESAGGGAVSILCTLPEANQYFKKAYAMSGTVNQISEVSTTIPLVEAIQNEDETVKWQEGGDEKTWEGYDKIDDLVKLPEVALQAFWDQHQGQYQHPVRGVGGIASDPFNKWEDGTTKDITVLQGYTRNEFRYYQHVFNEYEEMYDAICRAMQFMNSTSGGDAYRGMWNNYKNALEKLGYSEKQIYRMYADDFAFNTACDYQAEAHANSGGKGYCYIFDKGYDGVLEYLGAAHAVDCFYLFGQFNGDGGVGSKEEVDFSRNFQAMIANFCKTGKPSSDWEMYNAKTRKKMIINFESKMEENPEGERVKRALDMFKARETVPGSKDTLPSIFRYVKPLGPVIGIVAENDFNIFRTWSLMMGQDPLKVDYSFTIIGSDLTLETFPEEGQGQPGTTVKASLVDGYYRVKIKKANANDDDQIVIYAVTTTVGGIELYVYEGSYFYIPDEVEDDTLQFYVPADAIVGDLVIYASIV